MVRKRSPVQVRSWAPLFLGRSVAQLVEHRSPKPTVAGSSPAWPAIFFIYIMFDKISQFLGEVRIEMGKVTWPTRDELKSSTTIVLILSLALAGFIYIVDTILANIMEFILI